MPVIIPVHAHMDTGSMLGYCCKVYVALGFRGVVEISSFTSLLGL